MRSNRLAPHAAFATSFFLALLWYDLVSLVLGLGMAIARSEDQTSVQEVLSLGS